MPEAPCPSSAERVVAAQVRKAFDMDHETITKLAEQEEAGSSGANFLPFLTGQPCRFTPALLPACCAYRLKSLCDERTRFLNLVAGPQRQTHPPSPS